MRPVRIGFLIMCLALASRWAGAQTTPAASTTDQDWYVTIYPILAWVPLDIAFDANVPPTNGAGEGASGRILNSRFDRAFFAGATASNGVWRVDGYGLWARFGGDRPDHPFLDVDLDLIYGSAKLGRRIAPDLFVNGGVRRLALDYDVSLAALPTLSRKPGLWDPIVGIGWHRVRPKVEWHASFDGGGFGAGADVDLGTSLSVDWKPLPHFNLTAGYNLLYLKVSDTVASRDLTMKLAVHGPTVGFGVHF